jgi:type IV pilus assembly protein PilB
MASKAPCVLADLTGVTVCQSVIEMIPESVARASLVVPLEQIGETLVLATNHPCGAELVTNLKFILNKNIELVWAERQQIINAIERHYPNTETETVDSMIQEFVN